MIPLHDVELGYVMLAAKKLTLLNRHGLEQLPIRRASPTETNCDAKTLHAILFSFHRDQAEGITPGCIPQISVSHSCK